ncbi:MAG: invasin domain 3-containing protein [Candidatus Pristimantibacillus sp.]
MKGIERNKRWIAMMLILLVSLGWLPGKGVFAASAVLDQQQTVVTGNIWVSGDYPRYQTFTPEITGDLSEIELYVDGRVGQLAIQVAIYKESDLSKPIAHAQLGTFPSGWVSIDFSGDMPYLVKDTMYRMVVSCDLNNPSGFAWYTSSNNPYTRGDSVSSNIDFTFKTHMIADYSTSPIESRLSAAQPNLVADGVSQTTVTVELKDAQGNDVTTGGATVAITSTLGTVSSVTDNNNGTYTATLTSSTSVGTATINASVGGSAIGQTAIVQFVPGAPSIANSTIEAGNNSLTANGTSQTTVAVKLKDAHGNPVTTGGATVAITTTLGTVSSVTDNNNGTYTATLTAPTSVGTATISASVGGNTIGQTAIVQFVPGGPSLAKSTIEAGNNSLTANGTSQTTVTVKLKDTHGNSVTTGGSTIDVTTTQGTISSGTDNNNGTYTAILTSSTSVGTATISASIGGNTISQTAIVQFVPGAPSIAKSTIEAGNNSLTADGTSQTTVAVKLKDAHGNPVTTGGATVAITTTLGTVSSVTDNNNGTYTATLTSSTSVGTATISASVGGSSLSSSLTVQFLVGEISSSKSTVSASDLVVRADGTSKALVSVKLMDEFENPIAGKSVRLEADGGQSIIDDIISVTGQDGLATFSVSNIMAENVIYSAKEAASGLSLDTTVNITFTYDQPPHIELQAVPIIPTYGSVDVKVTASVYGDYNSVSSIKWAAGSQPLSYFDTMGTEITDQFTVLENGIYSVYVKDTAGNANVSLIDINNIIPLSSNADLIGWELTGVGGTVNFNFDPGNRNNSVNVGHSVSGLTMRLAPSDAHSVIYVNGVQIASNLDSNEYSLATGNNPFEVSVHAQDGSIEVYKLNVIRAAASSTGSSEQLPPSNSLVVRINDKEIAGIAHYQLDANGVKSIDVLVNMDTLKKITDSSAPASEKDLSIAIPDVAGKVALRLSGEAVAFLAGKAGTITLTTSQGQYRLPLDEVVNQESGWSNKELHITIELGKSGAIAGLQAAAKEGGFQLAADVIHFNVYVLHNGKTREITKFDRYVERVIYLSKDFSKASTVMVWDPELGVRPVPTEFTQVDGHQAAVIRSLTNSTYIVVSKISQLTDIHGHWAAAEITDMNNRMIVNGVDGSRFAPEAYITRAELAALLARALGLPEGGEAAGLSDVSKSSWYSGAVAAVKAYGIMDGYEDGTFRPNQEVSRQEAIVTIVRAMQLAKSVPAASDTSSQVDLSLYTDKELIGNWAINEIQTAIHEGLVKGYGDELRPQQSLTRAETTVLLHRMLVRAGLIN